MIPILGIHSNLSDSLEFSLGPSLCLCPGSNLCEAALAVEPTASLGRIFTLLLHQPCRVASAEPHCHLLWASPKQLGKSCQILWDAFVLQNTSRTAINQHLLKLILTCSLTFKGITRHTALLDVYMKRSLQEREQQ